MLKTRFILPVPKLTKEEQRFLDREAIPHRWVSNVRQFHTLAECHWWMDTTSTCVGVGFRRCDKGHRLMNKRGRCIQCTPALLKRTRRWIQYGYVYLAESKATGLI